MDAKNVKVIAGLDQNPMRGVLNFVGRFGAYRRPSLRTLGLDLIPIDDF